MVAAVSSDAVEVSTGMPGQGISPQAVQGAPDLSDPSPSTSTGAASAKAYKKSTKEVARSAKTKKASKASSKLERQKDKPLECLYKRASGQKTPASLTADRRQSSLARQALQLSPQGRDDREASLDLIDTSGIWGSAQDLQTLPHQGNYALALDSDREEAAFPFTSQGLRPDQMNPMCMANMQVIIANAIQQGIAAGLQQMQGHPGQGATMCPAGINDYTPAAGSLSPAPAQDDQASGSEEGEIREVDLLEDEGMTPDQPAFSGLFQPSLFKSLLFKAKTSANFGSKAAAAPLRTEAVSAETLFSEQTIEAETIATPKIFVDLVQHHWASPTSGPMPSSMDKKMFSVDKDLAQIFSTPMVDASVTALYTSGNLPGALEDTLKQDEKRADITVQRGH